MNVVSFFRSQAEPAAQANAVPAAQSYEGPAVTHSHAHSHGDYIHSHAHGHSPEQHPHRPDQTPLSYLDRTFGRLGLYRSEEHTSELQSHLNLVCRLLLEKKKKKNS